MVWFKYEATDEVSASHVLEEGILAINKDTGEFKIGDNETAFNDLPVFGTPLISLLPTEDPLVAGALWNNEGVFMVSAGE